MHDTPQSPLLHNLVLFVRLLRNLGLRVTSGQLIELTASLDIIQVTSREDFKNAGRCILVNRHEDCELYDRAFDIFWRSWSLEPYHGPPDGLQKDMGGQIPRDSGSWDGRDNGAGKGRKLKTSARLPAQNGEVVEQGEESILVHYSSDEVLRTKDFSQLTQDELADAKRSLADMRWEMTMRRSRRVRPSRRGRRLDVRRSIRRSLRHGGEMIDLSFRGPKFKRRQLVVLCDISGSMERYTRLLLHFLHSVGSNLQQIEVFVFSTRLTRITPALQRRDPDAALAAIAAQVQDWAGGTRMGEALHTFNRRWARRVLEHGPIVVVISDGWDRGDPSLLAVEMERLRRASYRLIWLNPLLGGEDYRPLTQGMQAALPYVDDFLSVHNLESLGALAGLLNAIQDVRPERKQVHLREPFMRS